MFKFTKDSFSFRFLRYPFPGQTAKLMAMYFLGEKKKSTREIGFYFYFIFTSVGYCIL